MKKGTRVWAVVWMLLGTASLSGQWVAGIRAYSMLLFAGIMIAGGLGLLTRQAWGWFLLITMSAFVMVLSLFTLLQASFLSPDMSKAPFGMTVLQIKILTALAAGAVALFARLSFVALRSNPPAQWTTTPLEK